MEIALTGDWHAKGENLDDFRTQSGAMVSECVEHNVDVVIVPGDIFDKSSVGDKSASVGAVAEAVIETIAALTEAGIHVYMTPGNHDIPGAGSADALHIFDRRPLVTIVREPRVVEIKMVLREIQAEVDFGSGLRGAVAKDKITTDIAHVLFVPWSWNGGNAEEIISSAIEKHGGHIDIIAPHIETIGAIMSGTFTLDGQCESAPGKWQIRRAFLESLPVDHVAEAHFHKRHDLTDGRGGYVGALMQHTFGEEGNPAGFEIYDTETKQAEWVELDAAPRYKTIIAPDASRPRIVASQGYKTKVIYEFTPDPIEVRTLEAGGVIVERRVEREERIQRVEISEGAAEDVRELMKIWGGAQEPKVSDGRLDRMKRLHDGLYEDPVAGVAFDIATPLGDMSMEVEAKVFGDAVVVESVEEITSKEDTPF